MLLRHTFPAFALAAACLAAPAAQAGNLVTNGSFETGDFTGWTLSGVTTGNSVIVDATHATDGTHVVQSSIADPTGFISQTISTVAGGAYLLSFALANTGFSFNLHNVFWNGVAVISDGALPPFDMTGFSAAVIGTGSDTLTFEFYNKHGSYFLDNVQLNEAVPEPASLALLGIGLAGLGALRRRGPSPARG